MSKQRRNTPIFDEAGSAIFAMERNVLQALTTTDGLTPDDFINWIYPADALERLRGAAKYASYTSGLSSTDTLDLPSGDRMYFLVEFKKLNCITPVGNSAGFQPDAPKAAQCLHYVESVAKIRSQYDRLREIVRFFNDNRVTPGAARYYWPTMQSLLPKSHAFFQVKSDRHKDVHFPSNITDYLREAPAIIAKGLLCPPIRGYSDYGPMRLYVNNGIAVNMFPKNDN